MKEESTSSFWGWAGAVMVAAIAVIGWVWQPQAAAQSSKPAAPPAPSKKVAAPARKAPSASTKPVAKRPAPRKASILGALLLPRPEETLKQVTRLVEQFASKDIQKLSDDFIRNVGRRLFPHLKQVKLHRAGQLLPALIRPLGVDLGRPMGVMVWALPYNTQLRYRRLSSRAVHVIMLSVDRVRLLASLSILGMSPKLQTYKGASLLTLGTGGSGSALGVFVGDRFYFTTRSPNRFIGLRSEQRIRDFLVTLAKGNDPFASVYKEAGHVAHWKSHISGSVDVSVVLPKLSRFERFFSNPYTKLIKSVGASVSMKNGLSTNFFIRATPALAPVFAPFVPGSKAKDPHAVVPANVSMLSHAHLHIKQLLEVPGKLVAAQILPPMLGMMAQGRLMMFKNVAKKQGFDIDALLGMLSGQFVTGSIDDQIARAAIAYSPLQTYKGHMHGVFAVIGLSSRQAGAKILDVFLNTYNNIVKRKPGLAKRVVLTKEQTQGLASLKIQLKGALPYYLVVKDDLLGFAGSARTRDDLISVWNGAAPSLAQHLKRHPKQASVFGSSRRNFFTIVPDSLRRGVAELRNIPPKMRFVIHLLRRLEELRFHTHFGAHSVSSDMNVVLSPAPRFAMPARYSGPTSKLPHNGPNMTSGASAVLLAPAMLAGLPVAALGALGLPAFLRFSRKSKTSVAARNIKLIGDGAVVWFDAEHSNEMGDPLPKHFPGKSSTKANPKRFEITTPKAKPCSNGNPLYKRNPSIWNKQPWKSLKFGINKKHYFQYRYITEGTGHKAKFTIFAHADLDCDGKLSTYRVTGRVMASGEVARSQLVVIEGLE